MSKKESQELRDLLKKNASLSPKMRATRVRTDDCCEEVSPEEKINFGKATQWTTSDDKKFMASGDTRKRLPPGVYEIHICPAGKYFEKIPVRTEGLLRFPQTNSEKVLKQIDTFWKRENLFKEYKLPHKRGVLLYGPPGSGKSSLINLIMNDVVEERKGIVVKFPNANLFADGMRELREIEPETPIVVLMEDIDAILMHNESQILNILDGVEVLNKIVFLATTNYPELLGPRIINRPSRFDKKFKIDHPNEESRTIYFKHLCGDKTPEELGINLDKWVRDSEGFSIAHLKELFVAVVILGDDYEESLEDLRCMSDEVSSHDDSPKKMGLIPRGYTIPDGCCGTKS